jgi:hypothetical protein
MKTRASRDPARILKTPVTFVGAWHGAEASHQVIAPSLPLRKDGKHESD